MEEIKSKVYIKLDEDNNIICCDGGYTMIDDLENWVQIDEGLGDKYNLCQNHYFEKSVLDEKNIPRYKFIDKMIIELE